MPLSDGTEEVFVANVCSLIFSLIVKFSCLLLFHQQKHMGDADYLAVFHHILLPIAYEVCAGMRGMRSVCTQPL